MLKNPNSISGLLSSLEATPFAAREEGSGEDVSEEVGHDVTINY